MKAKSTIRKHIRDLREFIDRPVSASTAPEHIIQKRMAYCVEVVLRYETEKVVGWKTPLLEVLEEAAILARDLRIKP